MSPPPEELIAKFGRRDPKMYGRIRLHTLGDEQPKVARAYLLKGIIYPGDLIFLTGDPGTGKTTLTQYIALAIAQGRSIFGRRVKLGRVLYLAFEGKDLFLLKMGVLEKRFGTTRNVVYATQSLQLLCDAPNGSDAMLLLQLVKDEKIDLLVCDTWSKLLAGHDDNKHEVASGMISVLDRIREETGAAVVVNAHPNRTRKGDVGGSFTVVKDCDALFAVEIAGDIRTVRAVKLRFDKLGEAFSFKLKRVVVEVDDDGDEITCVDLEEVDSGKQKTKQAVPKLSPQAKRAFDCLREAIDESGEVGVVTGRPLISAIHRRTWLAAGIKRGLGSSDSATDKAIQRATDALANAKLIGVAMPYIWITTT